ncbi:MAG: argininosuccinate lyase, partial [Planctomycetales bacterium]|nr:argininosuccinate lyase [Planctomycetales bacterium]
HLVGKLVGEATARGVSLRQLDAQVFQDAHPVLDESVRDVLGVENAIAAFCSYGSTSPAEVKKQIQGWQERLQRT